MKTQLIVALTLLVPSIYLTGCSTVLSEKIESVSHGVDVGEEKLVYRVYLPPSYEAEPNRQYPSASACRARSAALASACFSP